ncbi:MAG: magnesium-translocating P-type ATPase [Patescibacteria group bacterium]|nr:magnesium-translocating P-type ATPase [Patescibacteria group bacterium]
MPVNGNSAPWSKNLDQTFKTYQTSLKGLSHDEANLRLKKYGLNEIQGEKNIPGWLIFLRQFKSPLVLILLFASAIAYFLGEPRQVIMIIVMVGMSSVLAFVQEYRSERALRLLRKKLTRYASIIRNGKQITLDAREIVLGDLVLLEPGTVISADLRIVKTNDLETDESVLTGESMPVPKSYDAIAGRKLTPQDQVNMAFMGTHVVQGSGLGVVVAVGKNTEMGRTAALLGEKVEETDFQKGVRSFSNFLLKVTIGLILVAAIGMGLIRGNWIESLLFALALAVGLSPELFPMIVTINLSRGAIHLSQKQVMVKKLMAIEDLGNADVFCTDKTGTLTVGKIRVRESVDAEGKPDSAPLLYASRCLALDPNGRAENPIDQAIFEEAKHEALPEALKRTKLFDVVSFDFSRRRMSCVLGKKDGQRYLITKGAVKETVQICSHYWSGSNQEKSAMNAGMRKKLASLSDKYQSQGYRLIAVARREIGEQSRYSPQDEKDLELIGFILMSDAPKQTAKAALAALQDLNVRINILTGDSERITRHVAEQLGFKISGLLTGDQIGRMDKNRLEKAVELANVFTGITPSQKLQIIQALKKHGHTVGFMGDGINDAPSLRAADVGISFENAVDVAKEAASVILLKKNLGVLCDGIREGRRTFANTQTYINTTISSNFGNMLSLAFAALFLPFVPMLPAQILLLNLLGDVPMLGISTDKVSDEDLAKPRKWDIKRISNFMWFFGPISSLADFATFGIMYFVVHANVPLFRSGWFVESLITEVVVILLLRSRKTSLANPPSKILITMCLVSIAIAVFIVQSTFGSQLEFMPLSPKIIGLILLIVVGYGIVVQLGKSVYYRFIQKTA